MHEQISKQTGERNSMFPSMYMKEPIPDWGKNRYRLHDQGRNLQKRKE
jgi:hypothetical protein